MVDNMHEKILDSDWPKAGHFKILTPVQITHRNSGLRFVEDNRKFSMPTISRTSDDENILRQLCKKFPRMRKSGCIKSRMVYSGL